MPSKKIPYLRESLDGATQLIVDEKPFLMIAGEVHNSSSSSLEYMAPIWDRLADLNLNTVLAPISWEMIEPTEGHFDFVVVDGLIRSAREHGMRLIPLWFGTWKNSFSSYVPAWVKTDLKRFPRAEVTAGIPSTTISAHCAAAETADALAFSALMKHIREVDTDEQTVIMVQVENEVGLLGSARDRSAAADKLFDGLVAPKLIGYLRDHRENLHPYLAEAWDVNGSRSYGTWTEVFNNAAEEIFTAWYTGLFIGKVAAAGMTEYDLPMFVNAWLVQHPHEKAGEYPSGGPVTRMIDVWRAAAPTIALIAPDIYVDDFVGVCAEYDRPGNPLLIPEARRDNTIAAHAFYAIGEHDAIAFSPFGIDSVGVSNEHVIAGAAADASFTIATDTDGRLVSQAYRLLRDMASIISSYQGTGQMAGVLQVSDEPIEMPLERYKLKVTFNRPIFEPLPEPEPPDDNATLQMTVDEDKTIKMVVGAGDPEAVHPAWNQAPPLVPLAERTRIANRPPAGGLIISVDPDTFIVAGFGFSVAFSPLDGDDRRTDFVELWEGDYRDGDWQPLRRLNGDEYSLRLDDSPCVRRAKLFLY